MKKGFFLVVIVALASTLSASELKFIHFKQEGEVSKLELEFSDENIIANKYSNPEDKQIFIDLKGTTASDRVRRGFDTSEFSGSVVFVKTYPKSTSPTDLRVALQLRENVRSLMQKVGNRLVLSVENRFGVFTQSKIEAEEGANVSQGKQDDGVRINVPKSDSLEDILENLTLAGPKKYIGKKISLNVKNISIEDILNMIAESSGFNVIITDEVRKLPPVSITLTNLAWDEILDTVLDINKLVAKKNGAILLINSLAKATEEKKLEIEAKKLTEKEEPLVTKVFLLSFASNKDMQKILTSYATKERGSIEIDERTNSLIVRDTADIIERIRKIIEVLDTQTPQVLIESKIIEVNENYSRRLGLSNGVKFGFDPIGSQATTTAIVGNGAGTSAIGGPGFSFNSAPGGAGEAFMGLMVGRFQRLINLDFQIEMMESEEKVKVISNPKVIAENKKKAQIRSADYIPYRSQSDPEAGTIEWKELEAKLSLEVTPQITNDGSILMDVEIEKDEFKSVPEVLDKPVERSTRSVKTSVLVDNGSTAVIGGIYRESKQNTVTGAPFLKDLPIIGWLFRRPDQIKNSKTELVVFLTPRIINQEEAGLVDSVDAK